MQEKMKLPFQTVQKGKLEMTDISFEKFDGLVNTWINGERPDLEDLFFDDWNVEAMIRFMLDIPPEFDNIIPENDDCNILEYGDIPFPLT